MKNNLYRFMKEKAMMVMVILVKPIIICLGVYFGSTDSIKGVYLAEVNFEGNEPTVISYGKEEITKSLEASLKGESYIIDKGNDTVQGKLIEYIKLSLIYI